VDSSRLLRAINVQMGGKTRRKKKPRGREAPRAKRISCVVTHRGKKLGKVAADGIGSLGKSARCPK